MSLMNADEYDIGTVILWRPAGQTWTRVVIKLAPGTWGWVGTANLDDPAHVMPYSEVKALESEFGMWVSAFKEAK